MHQLQRRTLRYHRKCSILLIFVVELLWCPDISKASIAFSSSNHICLFSWFSSGRDSSQSSPLFHRNWMMSFAFLVKGPFQSKVDLHDWFLIKTWNVSSNVAGERSTWIKDGTGKTNNVSRLTLISSILASFSCHILFTPHLFLFLPYPPLLAV